MDRPPLEVADIFRACDEAYRQLHPKLSGVQLAAIRAIESCRTAALGGHLQECDRCGHEHPVYNSCRNRNCPKCQSIAAGRWLEKERENLLPVPYFHVVFTVPEEIAAIALGNQRVVYGILFDSVSRTLLQIGADEKHLGARIGFLAVLHTWGQTLEFHPHIHCVVPGGGIDPNGEWIAAGKRFFLPVKVLSLVFRGKLLQALNRAYRNGKLTFTGKIASLNSKDDFNKHLGAAAKKSWVVYCKPPFAGPEQVLQYLSRYTHRIAISNRRLLSFADGNVTFSWKDYRDGAKRKPITLTALEFIRRFLMHVVPKRFFRIRHYGFLANRNRSRSLQLIHSHLNSTPPPSAASSSVAETRAEKTWPCPACNKGTMKTIRLLQPVRLQDSS